VKSLRFVLDGTPINTEKTIAENGIEDGDVIGMTNTYMLQGSTFTPIMA
jgi:hypothetical protein